jgi:predicted PurR-regulated permease PerM
VPGWLRSLGTTAWLLVGITALLAGIVWLLALTDAIVMPVLTAAIIAAVLSPLVRAVERRVKKRAIAAAIVFLGLIVVGVGIALLILGGIVAQADGLVHDLRGATDHLRAYLNDLGVNGEHAKTATADASGAVSDAFHALLDGLGRSLTALASLAVFLSFTAISLFFLLKDGGVIRTFTERHMGVAPAVAHVITGRMLEALRGYFLGVTVVAAFNGIVIGGGALLLGVPRAGSIAIVNFVCAYIPYLGAWSAGAFTVLVALGAKGPETALAMAVIALLANGALQQLIQPIAYGATLDLHPLAVLIVTIAAGSLFGTIGLVLAAPLTSAAVRISADLKAAREKLPPAADGQATAGGARVEQAAPLGGT